MFIFERQGHLSGLRGRLFTSCEVVYNNSLKADTGQHTAKRQCCSQPGGILSLQGTEVQRA